MDTLVMVAIFVAILAILATVVMKKDSDKKSASKSSSKSSAASTTAKKPKVMIVRDDLTAAEVAKHNTRESCWIIVDNNVYDVTDYIDDHPGGDAIMNHAGGDSTEGAHGPQHPPSMWDVLKLFYIGELKQ